MCVMMRPARLGSLAERPLSRLLHRAAHHGDVVEVDAGLGLVEQREVRLLRQELAHLGALGLAAREAHVHVAVEHLAEFELLGDGATAAPPRSPPPDATSIT